MSAITTPRNLHACVKYREIHGTRGLPHHFLQQQLVTMKVCDDHLFSYHFNPGACSYIKRKGNWVAYAQGNQISLHNLVTRNDMWHCEVPIHNPVQSLDISDQGAVNVFSRDELRFFIVHTIFRGMLVSEGLVTSKIENAPFLITLPPDALQKAVIHSLAIKALNQSIETDSPGLLFDVSATTQIYGSDFYVLIASRSFQDRKHTKAFVFDHHRKERRTFDVVTTEAKHGITFATVHKNHLFCAIHTTKGVHFANTEIIAMNLMTGSIDERYNTMLSSRNIKCLVNEDYIVYLGTTLSRSLLCMNARHADISYELKSFPHLPIRLSFAGELLNVCYHTQEGVELSVFDLSTRTTVKKVHYNGFNIDYISFEEGKLVIFEPGSSSYIYVEDFISGGAADSIPDDLLQRRRIT